MGYFAGYLRVAFGDGTISMAGHQRPETSVYAGLVCTCHERLLYWDCNESAYRVDLVGEGWLLQVGASAGTTPNQSSRNHLNLKKGRSIREQQHELKVY